MKTAISDNGEIIEASPAAPETAVCPHCGSPVTLRKRRSMSGHVTFFWRHCHGHLRPCQGRSGPVFRNTNEPAGSLD
jgi:hypothetical protein